MVLYAESEIKRTGKPGPSAVVKDQCCTMIQAIEPSYHMPHYRNHQIDVYRMMMLYQIVDCLH